MLPRRAAASRHSRNLSEVSWLHANAAIATLFLVAIAAIVAFGVQRPPDLASGPAAKPTGTPPIVPASLRMPTGQGAVGLPLQSAAHR